MSALGEEVSYEHDHDTLNPVYDNQVAILKVDEAIVADLEAVLTVLDEDAVDLGGRVLRQAKADLKTLLCPPSCLSGSNRRTPHVPSKVQISGHVQVKVWVENWMNSRDLCRRIPGS